MPDRKLEAEALDHLAEAFDLAVSAGCENEEIGDVVNQAFLRANADKGEVAELPDAAIIGIQMNTETAAEMIKAFDPENLHMESIDQFRQMLIDALAAVGSHMAEHHANGE